MPLEDRWYMHDKDCECQECKAHKTKMDYFYANPEKGKESRTKEYEDWKKVDRKIHHWWDMFFPGSGR